MHIKVFDKFSLGKLGNKNKNLQEASEKLNEPGTEAVIKMTADDIPVRPHGPAAELTLEPEDQQKSADITLDEVGSDDAIKTGGDIKIAEVSVEKAAVAKVIPVASVAKAVPVAAAAVPVEAKKESKPDEVDSLKNLFSNDEEEDNPLASLINSLPDVTVRELLDDLTEIHRIIKEWKPTPKPM
jgi:hypothetical protein